MARGTGTDGDLSDETLVLRWQRGERAAFARLLERWERPVLTFVLRLTRDRAAAEDLTQEVFCRLISRSNELKVDSRFAAWLFAVARNLCIDHSRRLTHRRHASLDDEPTSGRALADVLADPTPAADQERSVTASRATLQLNRALGELPEEQREVFLLRELAGLSFREIATITGTNENTIKSRLRYALERLQQALADYAEEMRALR